MATTVRIFQTDMAREVYRRFTSAIILLYVCQLHFSCMLQQQNNFSFVRFLHHFLTLNFIIIVV